MQPPVSAHRTTLAFLIAVALAPAVAAAQSGSKPVTIPNAQKPPAGMCRIWVDGVPPDKQPAPTDCATALRNKPTHAQGVFGESKAAPRQGSSAAAHQFMPPINGFASQRGRSSSRGDTGKAGRDSSNGRDSSKGRDSSRAGRDTTAKKPPPA